MLYSIRKIIILFTTIAIVFLSACSPASPKPSEITSEALSLLQERGNLAAEFSGLVTFKQAGTTVISKTDFTVPPISIEWMGFIFSGELKETVSGNNVSYQVHGSTSQDGLWLSSMTYSKQVTRTDVNSGTLYRITLRNVPIARISSGVVADLGIFERSGSDIRKFIDKIEFIEGPIENGNIQKLTSYLSIDWASTDVEPTLKLRLASGPGREKQLDTLALLQQNKEFTVSLFIMMTMDFAGTKAAFPTELIVPPVPIEWKDRTFSGKVEKAGLGGDITYQVNGQVSPDGLRMESLVYLREVRRLDVNQGTNFKVTLRDVPLDLLVSGKVEDFGKYELTGANVQKFVGNIEYVEGLLSAGTFTATTTYDSTDWNNANFKPSLKLSFTGKSGQEDTTTLPKGGMMSR